MGQAQMRAEDAELPSVSNSLNFTSHSQVEAEYRDRRKRDQTTGLAGRQHRNQTSNTSEEDIVPTIWNDRVLVDDLDYWEAGELDNDVENWDFAREHHAKRPLNDVTSVPAPLVIPPKTTTTHDQTKLESLGDVPSSSAASSTALSPPKSLAKALRLISHALFRDRTHRGHRRNSIPNASLECGHAGAGQDKHLEVLLHIKSGRDNSPKRKRDGKHNYSELLDTRIKVDAYDEFREKHPKYFDEGTKHERSMPTITGRRPSVEARNPTATNWLAMLFSPSALLRKRPVREAISVQNRDSTQGTSNDEAMRVPDEVPSLSKTPPSTLRTVTPSSLKLSDAQIVQRRNPLAQYPKSMTDEHMGSDPAHRSQEWLATHEDETKGNDKGRMPPARPVRRDTIDQYTTAIPQHGSDSDEEDFYGDEWFEATFIQAWDEEHSKKE